MRRRRLPIFNLVVVLKNSHCPAHYGQQDTRRCQAAERRAAAICGERRRICA